MDRLRVTQRFSFVGRIPEDSINEVQEALESVSSAIFFDTDGAPITNREIKDLDRQLVQALKNRGHDVDTDYCPFREGRFHCDIALRNLRMLVEIEKGNYPRLELDVLKMGSAFVQEPDLWKHGVLVVPSSYITLRLAGRDHPTTYLRRLSVLARPLLDRIPIAGIAVLGYEDPRSQSKSPNPTVSRSSTFSDGA